jgi:glycosyltransferase involved in cell wall biosynthesis
MHDAADRSLSVLFAVNTPWTETLGVSRVSIELGRQLTALGHRVEKFSLEDVRPRVGGRIGGMLTDCLFQRALLKHIRAVGPRFDVIQAEHNMLVFPRSAYRFDGQLIAKSNGLRHFYAQYVRTRERQLRRAAGDSGTIAGNMLRAVARWLARGTAGAADRSFRCADQIHLLNDDELRFVRDNLGHGDKCFLIGNGLTESRADALARSGSVVGRQASRTVAFVGTWCFRKGKTEIPAIFRRIRSVCPDARLRLLGVNAPSAEILGAFAVEDRSSMEIVERFEPDELPGLLSDARVGLFPSYIEGFGLGLLEMLAAGLPVVAWDVPGPRQLLNGPLIEDLVSPGDIPATVRRLEHHLGMAPAEFEAAAQAATISSAQHRWSRIASRFLDAVQGARMTGLAANTQDGFLSPRQIS